MIKPFLEVRNLGKQYEEQVKPALSSINFSLSQGQVLSILGRSGSGKSSLLRILGGLLDASEGEARLESKRILGPSEQLVSGHNHIRLVAQGFQLAPKMRVWENLRYFLLKWPREKQEQRIDELLKLCGLSEERERFPRELSGGQQQRLALGRALADYPQLLLLDEPFSHLDPALRYELRDTLETLLAESGTTAIMATHQPEDALYLSDYIAVLREGEISQIGTPKEIYYHPVSPYVAKFFGQPNIISGDSPIVPKKLQKHLLLGLREEALEIKSGRKTIKGYIASMRFLGNRWEIIVDVDGELLKLYHSKAGLSEGKTCSVKIDWQQAITWD